MPNLLIALILISVLILIHELGHFLAAKLSGVKVEEFGLGYPPRVFGKKIGETIYSLNALPFGGFVKLFGEEEKEKGKVGKKNSRAFYAKNRWQKSFVILAGVVANFVLGIVIFSAIYTKIGIPTKIDNVLVKEVAPNSPAQKAGIKAGSTIISVNGQKTNSLDNFIKVVEDTKGKESVFVYQLKEGGKREAVLTPRFDPPEGEGAIGVAVTDFDNLFYPAWQMPFRGAWTGIREAFLWGATILFGLALSIKQLFSGVVPEIAGPVGLYKITSDVAAQGWIMFLKFAGVLSINLAVLNALPIPALDGGRFVFLLFDRFIKKEARPKIESTINAVGMAFLLVFMLLITANDIWRILKEAAFFKTFISYLPF